MKLKMIAAAVALVASGSSFANIVGPADGGGTAGAELFLSVWQQAGTPGATNRSFTLDLGVTLDNMISNQNTNLFINRSITGSADWTSFLAAGTGTLQYSVVGADATDSPILLQTFAANTIAPKARQQVFDAMDQIQQYTSANNSTSNGTHNVPGNGQSFNTSGYEYYMTAASNTWNTATGNNSVNIGTSMIFGQVIATSAQNGVSQIYGGKMLLAQQGSDYVLTYSVQAVPEPTGIALALAGFGIVGFVARRRRST